MALLSQSLWMASGGSPLRATTVGSILTDAAADAAERTALIDWGLADGERRTWTYAEFERDARRAARALAGRFRPGERIALYAPNSAEWLLLEMAAGLAGLVLVTVNPACRARELDYILRQSRSCALFHVASWRGNPMREQVAEIRDGLPALREVIALEDWAAFVAAAAGATRLPQVAPLDAAQIQYTSGTTGAPKGALLHHHGLTNNARGFFEALGPEACAIYAHSMPFFHTAGCALAALGAIQARAVHAFLPGFDAGRMLELIEAVRATIVLAVPTMLLGMLEHPDFDRRDLASLRVVISGGASVPPELIRTIEARLGVRFVVVYGQTETSPLITYTRRDDADLDRAETVGRPAPHVDVKIIEPAGGAIMAPGVMGELCTRGYHVMHGYFDKPEATAATIDTDGWLHTGDLGTMDPRGYCRITGRLKDMVIRGGENLFPAEIEAVLHEHPDVVGAAVIGVADERMGEELAAFIRHGAHRPEVSALRAHVRSRLAAPKTPRYWVFVESYPLTGSGKIQKFQLRAQWERGECQAVDTAPRR